MSDPDLRSSTAPGLAVTHRVINQRSSPIRLYWLDYEGRAVSATRARIVVLAPSVAPHVQPRLLSEVLFA